MKLIFCIICIVTFLMLPGTVAAFETATVHGIAYEWSTFEPLDNTIIEVNSTPAQSIVAKYGIYSFELPNGSYLITAGYYRDNVLTYYGEEIVTVTGEGNYVIDLLLLPSYSDSGSFDTASASVINATDETNTVPSSNNLLAGSFLIGILLLAILVYQFHQKSDGGGKKAKKVKVSKKEPLSTVPETAIHKESFASTTTPPPVTPLATEAPAPENMEDIVNDMSTKETEPQTDAELETKVLKASESKNVESSTPKEETVPYGPVPADLQEILDILKSHDGRMTQKDMRQRLRYSEGKVSLMLLDLEKRGKIQKFKKGRGNVLFLIEEVNN